MRPAGDTNTFRQQREGKVRLQVYRRKCFTGNSDIGLCTMLLPGIRNAGYVYGRRM